MARRRQPLVRGGAPLLRQPANAWWDDVATDVGRDPRRHPPQALRRRPRRADPAPGPPSPTSWTWGQQHRLNLHSQTLGESEIGLVEWLFNRDGWKIGGGGSIVNATGWDAAEGYEVTSAPSMRMVVSLADLDDSRWVNLTGASGHAFNPHYTDQTDLWVDGRTLPWAWTDDAVDAAAEDTLTLVPASD